MHAASASPTSRWSVWRSLENEVDRWTSYGALALGVCTLVAAIVWT